MMVTREGRVNQPDVLAMRSQKARDAGRKFLFVSDFPRLAQRQAGDACVLGMKYGYVDTVGIGGVKILAFDDHALI